MKIKKPPLKKSSSRMMILAVVLCVSAATVTGLFLYKRGLHPNLVADQESTFPSPSPEAWTTYTNTRFKFSIDHPVSLEVGTDSRDGDPSQAYSAQFATADNVYGNGNWLLIFPSSTDQPVSIFSEEWRDWEEVTINGMATKVRQTVRDDEIYYDYIFMSPDKKVVHISVTSRLPRRPSADVFDKMISSFRFLPTEK